MDGAYLAIADAFDAYEEALYDAYDEVTPLTVFAEEDDDLDEDADKASDTGSGRDSVRASGRDADSARRTR